MAMIVFEILSQHAVFDSIFDVVCTLENIFGLVWKINKNIQIGLIGELLFIKNNPDYITELSNSYHIEDLKSKKISSKTDFEISMNNKTVNIEVKTTTSQDGFFTIKNEQVSKNINDFYVAIKIKTIKKGGQTLVDLINWYLDIPQLSSEVKIIFEEIKNSSDERTLIKFDNEDVLIKLVDIGDIPYIKSPSDKIQHISYKIDLFSLPTKNLNDIL